MLFQTNLLLVGRLGFRFGFFLCLFCSLPFAFGRQGGNAVDGFLETVFVGSSFLVGLNQRKLADGILYQVFRVLGLIFQIFHIPQGT